MRFEFYAPILLLIVTIIVCLGLGFLFLYRTRRAINKFHRAHGLIIALDPRGGDETSYSPVVRFTALDGKEIEFRENRANSNPDFQIGQQVIVLYHPKNFKQTRLLIGKRDMYFSSILLLGLGTVFFLMAVFGAIVFGALYLSGAMEKD